MFFFYHLFLALYKLGALLISPWNPKASAWLLGRKNFFKSATLTVNQLRQQYPEKKQVVWMHCASMGEYEQGRPVLETIKRKYTNTLIVVSFFSPSGYENRGDISLTCHYCFYLPLDSPKAARKWMELLQPNLVLWVKYEYWYYYLTAIKERNIPLLLISGVFRHGQVFFRWYGGFYRTMVNCFTHLFVQNEQSQKLLGSIGITETITLSGDTRFDRVVAIAAKARSLTLIEEQFVDKARVLVAGSTWEEDEEEMNHYANAHPEIKFIIAPHDIQESRLKEVEKLFHKCIRYSQFLKNPSNHSANVLIIDNIGMLSALYQYATITYVGGGFGSDGLHNVLEAAVYSKPVLFGSNYEKYSEAIDLVECGGAFSIESAVELEKIAEELFNNPTFYSTAAKKAGSYVAGKTGATEKIISFIQEKRLLTN
jgi:3-deoxy-D-manno-octulosonic-acid transferase